MISKIKLSREAKEMLAYIAKQMTGQVSVERAKLIHRAQNGDEEAQKIITREEVERFINQQSWGAFKWVNQGLIDFTNNGRASVKTGREVLI